TIYTARAGTQIYTFPPEQGQIAQLVELYGEIMETKNTKKNNQTQNCIDEILIILSHTADKIITVTWFPAQINTGTTGTQTYTFTHEMECAAEFQIEITISETITPEFTNLPVSYCLDTEPETLPSISDNGIAGNWFPSTINTSIQ